MELVDTPIKLQALSHRLSGARQLFLDTEFDSSRAGKRLSLIQVSREDSPNDAHLIDALCLEDLGSVRSVFASETVEWVLHAGLQDVELLVERLDIDVPERVFDTQVAWALLGPEHSVSLSYLKFRVLGIRAGKPHQADDWLRRPLPAPQLEYAADDIRELPALRRELGSRAEAEGKLETVYEASREASQPQRRGPRTLSLASFRNAWQLNRKTQAALRHLIDWYNGLDEGARNRAPDAKTLMSIASRLPRTPKDLIRIKGVPHGWAQRHGAELTRDLERAVQAARADDFVPIDPPPYATFEEIRTEAWLSLARAEVCFRLRVSPDLVLPARVNKQLLGELLDQRDLGQALSSLSGWRRDLLVDEMLDFARRTPPPFAIGSPA